ncbi:MAG: hypothetical protein ACJAUP_000248 [Cellvibrionaceae bacterium]|jgi:hypothetical protein
MAHKKNVHKSVHLLIIETFARKPFYLHAALKTYSIGHLPLDDITHKPLLWARAITSTDGGHIKNTGAIFDVPGSKIILQA